MRFKLEKSKEKEDWWVLTDTENLVVLKFEQHKFNETQQMSFINEEDFISLPGSSAGRAAAIMREMGDYMFRHWYSIALPVPAHEWREDEENDEMLLVRNKSPRFTVKIEEDSTPEKLADALRKAAEFVLKGNNIK